MADLGIDLSKPLFDFIWRYPHEEIGDIVAGGRREWIFQVPSSEEKKFWDLYLGSVVNGKEDLERFGHASVECVRGAVEMSSGPYCTRYAGYDMDGFYCPGPTCNVDCEKHVRFCRALWYHDNWPPGKDRLCVIEPSGDRHTYVVCIMKT